MHRAWWFGSTGGKINLQGVNFRRHGQRSSECPRAVVKFLESFFIEYLLPGAYLPAEFTSLCLICLRPATIGFFALDYNNPQNIYQDRD